MTALRDALLLAAVTALALLLTLLPMPEPVMAMRPHWLLLVLSAWVLQRDSTAVLPIALGCGLMLDATRGVALGMHGVALLLPLAGTLQWRPLLRALPLWQATLASTALFLAYALLMSLLDAATSEQSLRSMYWLGIPLSIVLWPLAVLLLHPLPAAKAPD